MDTISIRKTAPEVPASEATRECFACYEGIVYIGHMVCLPDGDEEETYESRRCGLCGGTGRIDASDGEED